MVLHDLGSHVPCMVDGFDNKVADRAEAKPWKCLGGSACQYDGAQHF